ncbi:pyridoxal phosphate-dependent aminotransferase [Sediminicola sp. 1XM1-17]|uniref:pyridoxal phosphate-dependent aminotransferase n=1 Tax=Sediminicola sp. 1XM1-17 TaxID=3127702 RepID=UPI0030776603
MYRKVEESQTLLINTQAKAMESQNKEVIKFGFGQSPFLPPNHVINALKEAAHRKEYSSVQGDLELRKLMSNFHMAHNGLKVDPDNILVAPGSKILLYTIMLAFEQADVLMPVPSWVSYAPQANLAGHHLIKLNTTYEERWRITPKIMEEAIKGKHHKDTIMLLNYPGNPDGLTYSQSELEAIAQVAKKHNILVISDEIYGLLSFDGPHASFANYYPERTITTTGLSKWCGAGGWRLGAAFLYDGIEKEFKQALIGIGSETYSCAPSPVQMAAKEAYADYNGISEYVSYQTKILQKIGMFCATTLNAAGILVTPPQGGFYIFLDFTMFKDTLSQKGITTSNELCAQLLKETGVMILPSSAFGFNTDHLGARLAFVDFDEPVPQEEFSLKKHGTRVIKGIELIVEWIESYRI